MIHVVGELGHIEVVTGIDPELQGVGVQQVASTGKRCATTDRQAGSSDKAVAVISNTTGNVDRLLSKALVQVGGGIHQTTTSPAAQGTDFLTQLDMLNMTKDAHRDALVVVTVAVRDHLDFLDGLKKVSTDSGMGLELVVPVVFVPDGVLTTVQVHVGQTSSAVLSGGNVEYQRAVLEAIGGAVGSRSSRKAAIQGADHRSDSSRCSVAQVPTLDHVVLEGLNASLRGLLDKLLLLSSVLHPVHVQVGNNDGLDVSPPIAGHGVEGLALGQIHREVGPGNLTHVRVTTLDPLKANQRSSVALDVAALTHGIHSRILEEKAVYGLLHDIRHSVVQIFQQGHCVSPAAGKCCSQLESPSISQ